MELELEKLAWSEWDMPHKGCIRIETFLPSQSQNKV
jgi:hypothetical protein